MPTTPSPPNPPSEVDAADVDVDADDEPDQAQPDALSDTIAVGSLPELQDFNSKYANNPAALRELEQAMKSKDAAGGRISWDNEDDVRLMLEALKKVEEGTGDIVATKGKGKNMKLVSVTCKSGDSGLQAPAQTFLAWVLREYGSSAMKQVTQQQVKNKHTDVSPNLVVDS